MNALVSYDSSDDDEIEAAASPVKIESVVSPQNVSDIAIASAIRDQNEKGQLPLLGPSNSSAVSHGYEQYDDDEADLGSPMSERDMIRHLTQASHPMTEMLPSPPGSPNPSAGLKFKQFLVLKEKGVHFNEDLASKSVFRNPSLLPTLLQRAGIDEQSQYCTSLPSSVFDAGMFPPSAFKEQLLRSQQKIRSKEGIEKKTLSATGKRSIDFASAGTLQSSSNTPDLVGGQNQPAV